MKPKKLLKYSMTFLLTFGASSILGFLSFGGMLAITPILALAFSAFALSIVYEGQIYWQNITGALNKLFFKNNYLQQLYANQLLRKNFPDTDVEDCPQFFKDYESQLRLLDRFNHQRLDDASKERKRKLEKRIRDMERWFAKQLFRKTDDSLNDYEGQIADWMDSEGRREEHLSQYNSRRLTFYAVGSFSVLAAGFMALGTTYLLMEAFLAIPLLATIPFGTLPLIIAPLAVVAGISYGFLTYNAVTDMINNKSVQKFFKHFYKDYIKSIHDEFKSPTRSWKQLGKELLKTTLMSIITLSLLSVAVGLTICTAGTWWTVVKNSQPLFAWMAKMPSLIMGIINPIITGASTIFFNLENIFETLSQVRGFFSSLFAKKLDIAKSLHNINTILHELDPNTFEQHQQELGDEPDYRSILANIENKMERLNENNDEKTLKKMQIIQNLTKQIRDALNSDKKEKKSITQRWFMGESWWQILNPFRILLKLTYMPLRAIFFLGHLVSIGVTSDRVPGIPQFLSALLGILSEGFEDFHYFFADLGHDHSHEHKAQVEAESHHLLIEDEDTEVELSPSKSIDYVHETFITVENPKVQPTKQMTKILLNDRFKEEHGHDHSSDLPTIFLKGLFYPLFKLAAYYDHKLSQHNEDPKTRVSWERANDKIYGRKPKSSQTFHEDDPIELHEWEQQHSAYLIDKYIDKHLESALPKLQLTTKKIEALHETKKEILHSEIMTDKEIFATHRFFGKGQTRTERFLEKLPEMVSIKLPPVA